jgi:ribulose-phosphate 3-epimerase
MRKIIPTIFAHNKKEFDERFKKLLPISKDFQIDFMDGKFVKGKSVKIHDIPDLKKYKKSFEAHLMVTNPEKDIIKLKKKGFKKIIFHIESTKNPDKVINEIKKLGMKCFIAVNPETKMDAVFSLREKINGVMFMGVHPGKENQKFIPEVYKKTLLLKKKFPKLPIQVDGGVNETTIRKLKNIGVNIANTGSYVNEAKNPKEALKKLKREFI